MLANDNDTEKRGAPGPPPSVLLQKSLTHSAMDAYVAVHGLVRPRSCDTLTGRWTDYRVLGAVPEGSTRRQVQRAKDWSWKPPEGRIESGHRCVRAVSPGTRRASGCKRYEAEGLDGIESDRPRSGLTPHGLPSRIVGEDRPEKKEEAPCELFIIT